MHINKISENTLQSNMNFYINHSCIIVMIIVQTKITIHFYEYIFICLRKIMEIYIMMYFNIQNNLTEYLMLNI